MVSQEQITLAVGALAVFGLIRTRRPGRRSARRATQTIGRTNRSASSLGRVLVLAAGITGAQWLIIHAAVPTGLVMGVLVVPALLAAMTVSRPRRLPRR